MRASNIDFLSIRSDFTHSLIVFLDQGFPECKENLRCSDWSKLIAYSGTHHGYSGFGKHQVSTVCKGIGLLKAVWVRKAVSRNANFQPTSQEATYPTDSCLAPFSVAISKKVVWTQLQSTPSWGSWEQLKQTRVERFTSPIYSTSRSGM